MGKRGRKSAASLRATPPPVEIVERIKPPHDLHDDEVEIWSAMVSERPTDWFSASSAPLLAQLCRHVLHARRVAELIKRAIAEISVNDYDRLLRMKERETRVIASLSTKLRLTPQATTNHRGNHMFVRIGRPPWMI